MAAATKQTVTRSRAAASKKTDSKKTATKKTAASKKTTRRAPAVKAVAKKAAPRRTADVAPEPASPAQVGGGRTGPVLGAYRLSLKALEGVSVGVGGVALGSLGQLGLPRGAAHALQNTHAGAIRGATRASDYVGTKVAVVIGKTVGVGTRAATYVFPE